MRATLAAAGLYNVLWGAIVVFFPFLLFDALQVKRPDTPWIWQCVGMVVGLYGVGYWIASHDPARHWPIVLVGFLGKALGPFGFLSNAYQGVVPWSFGWNIVANDLIWLVPFAAILVEAARRSAAPTVEGATWDDAMNAPTQPSGKLLGELTDEKPRVVVFLRHRGCTFCREALADLRAQRTRIESSGAGIVLISMSDDESARSFFSAYGLDDVPRISDPERRLYRAFDLRRGSILELLGPTVWLRGALVFFAGHGLGPVEGDGFQMPGTFVVDHRRIVRAFPYATAGDRPNYGALAEESCQVPRPA